MKNHDCGEPLFEVLPNGNIRRFQCPKCGMIKGYKEEKPDVIFSSTTPKPIKGSKYSNNKDGHVYEFDGVKTWTRIT
jgi:hypothetical protein